MEGPFFPPVMQVCNCLTEPFFTKDREMQLRGYFKRYYQFHVLMFGILATREA